MLIIYYCRITYHATSSSVLSLDWDGNDCSHIHRWLCHTDDTYCAYYVGALHQQSYFHCIQSSNRICLIFSWYTRLKHDWYKHWMNPTDAMSVTVVGYFGHAMPLWNRIGSTDTYDGPKKGTRVLIIINSLRPSDAYMRQWSNHHWFR